MQKEKQKKKFKEDKTLKKNNKNKTQHNLQTKTHQLF